ncbi:MAG: YabP/YqfC family sporulation protein [Clostridia bacterium]|nr:YabP/YqfC family sporulation protein [Clostridia bacterium]MBO7288881.1 YabP/YqfC family sporulation protein [Clostridia bacterium]
MHSAEHLVIGHSYKLIMYGDKICIKGKYDVTSYSEDSIMLRCNNDVLCIKGEDVVISSLDVNQIYISGKISDISFS